MKKKVQLVLGSGGARGIAHVGVLDMLLQDGFEIVEVWGSSMGAVCGAMYCAGVHAQYRDFLLKQTKADVYRLFDLTLSRKGFVKGERIFTVLEGIAGKQLIEKLPIPFVAIATDMINRKEVHFREGDLFKALRASTSLPGLLTPVAENNSLFVDGGVLNPLPVNLVQRREDAIVIAVNLNGPFQNEEVCVPAPTQDDNAAVENESAAILDRMRRYFNSLSKSEANQPVQNTLPTLSMFDILSASYDATLDRLVEVTLKSHPADVVIEIPRNACTTFEFYRAAELIELGKKSYAKAMGQYKGSSLP